MATVLRCHVGIGPRVEGEALVAKDNFSARYDLDRLQGTFSRPDHALAGQSYVDRILVVNADETVRIERVRARDGRSAAQIRAIIKNQADDSQRRAAANDMLDNNGSLDEPQHGVEKLHQRYTALAAQDNFM